MRVTAEFEADSIKIWLLRHRGDNQAEIREQGAQIDGPLNPSYSLLLHSTFLCITTDSRYALEEKGLGHVHTGLTEADDVSFPVRGYVCNHARVGVVAAPPAGADTEVGKAQLGGRKVPASGGQGYRDTVSAEADDVGHAVVVNVRKRARVEVVAAPTAGLGPEGGKLERGHRKVPACGGQRLVDPGRTKGDDVGSGVPADVCQLARVGVVAAPTAGVDAEGSKLERGGRKVPASGGEGHVGTG